MIEECLEQVVGLSASPCPCLEPPEGSDASLSGYYIDDMEDGVPLQIPAAGQDCGEGSVWDVLARARREGSTEFVTNLLATVSEQNTERYAPVSTSIGEPKANTPYSEGGSIKFMRIRPKSIKGVIMKIESVSLRINTPGVYSISVYDEANMGTALATLDIEIITSGIAVTKAFDSPVVLPLTNQYGDIKTYCLAYNAGSAKPYNIQFKCGCTGSANPIYERFFKAEASSVSSLGDIPDKPANSKYTNGLQVKITAACSGMDWICPADTEVFQTHKFYRVLAKTLQLHQINKLIGYILNSQTPNYYTLIEREALYGRRNHNRVMIEERLAWMAQAVPADATDCFVCKDANRITTKTILV